MSQRIPITHEGLEKIKAELKNLLTVERPMVQKDIAEARAHGDLKENAEYHAAKERQSFIEGRVQEINSKMANFQVVDPSTNNSGIISFGARVTIENVETEEVFKYQIVGPDEADIKINRISFMSPIAKALMGKQVGETVVVVAPKGKMEVEISEISYT